MKLAELFVEIAGDDRKLNTKLGQVNRQLSMFATAAKASLALPLTIVGAGAAAAAAATVTFLAQAATKAADLGETMNKVEVTFGDSSKAVKDFARDLNERFGIVENTTLDAAANFGLILQGMGASSDEASKLSMNLAKLAADATSFYNVPFDVALEKIRAGLAGEAEPLRTFGVNLTAAAVEAEAVRMGLVELGEELSDYDKAVARVSFITNGLSKANGDLERTADSVSNRMRKVQGQFATIQTEIGQGLIPVLEDLVATALDLNEAFRETFDKDFIDGFAESLQGVVGAFNAIGRNPGQTFKQSAMITLREWLSSALNASPTLTGIGNSRGLLGQWLDRFDAETANMREALIDSAVKIREAAQGKGGGGGAGGGGIGGGGVIAGLPSSLAVLAASLTKPGGGGMAGGLPLSMAVSAAMVVTQAITPKLASFTDQLRGAQQLQIDALKSPNDPAKMMVKEQQETNKILRRLEPGKVFIQGANGGGVAVARGPE